MFALNACLFLNQLIFFFALLLFMRSGNKSEWSNLKLEVVDKDFLQGNIHLTKNYFYPYSINI